MPKIADERTSQTAVSTGLLLFVRRQLYMSLDMGQVSLQVAKPRCCSSWTIRCWRHSLRHSTPRPVCVMTQLRLRTTSGCCHFRRSAIIASQCNGFRHRVACRWL